MSLEEPDIELSKPFSSQVTENKCPTLSQTKQPSKLVRVLTVLAYILSVSMVAILLSVYYIFIWKGGNPQTMPLTSCEFDQSSQPQNLERHTFVEDAGTTDGLEDNITSTFDPG